MKKILKFTPKGYSYLLSDASKCNMYLWSHRNKIIRNARTDGFSIVQSRLLASQCVKSMAAGVTGEVEYMKVPARQFGWNRKPTRTKK